MYKQLLNEKKNRYLLAGEVLSIKAAKGAPLLAANSNTHSLKARTKLSFASVSLCSRYSKKYYNNNFITYKK